MSVRRSLLLLAAGVVLVVPTAAPKTSAIRMPASRVVPENDPCTRYASRSGRDANAGTAARPFRTVQKLVDSLSAGETGCLLPGTFDGDVTVRRGGRPRAPVTLRSATPKRRATIVGRLWITNSANDVRIESLNLNGRGTRTSPAVMGDRATFVGNDVTNDHAGEICFNIGSNGSGGIAVGTVIAGNRIHNCGRLPPTNHHHGIYVVGARDTLIVDNYIYDNADRGVQLYPNAVGTIVTRNVIDGNGQGVIFSGSDDLTSHGNRVVRNIITNATVRYNVESYYSPGTTVGYGNLAAHNCVFNGARGNVGREVGFTAAENVVADPRFADRAAKDFRLAPGSPCAAMAPA